MCCLFYGYSFCVTSDNYEMWAVSNFAFYRYFEMTKREKKRSVWGRTSKGCGDVMVLAVSAGPDRGTEEQGG